MKKTVSFALCVGCISAASTTSHAMDLKQSKITQVVNDVEIISATDQAEKNAAVNDTFNMPDILRTGPSSRAELVAADETVTRVGANTIFSFDPANRTIDLKQGSLLFHSPHGKGGGTIHTGSATASVLGTTLIVTTTPTGGMKVLCLEGQVEVNFLNGLHQNLAPGQMTFVLPGGKQLAPIIVYRLDNLTKSSLLVKGFNQQLSSMPLIEQQIEDQLKLLKNGKLTDTGLLVGNDANSQQVQVIDPTTLQAAIDNSGINSKGVIKALSTDATINQPSLTDHSIPTPPQRVFLTQFTLPKNTFFTGQPFEGFAGKDISFNTPGVDAPALSVDLSPYANQTEFDMVALKNMNFDGSVSFGGFSPENNVYFDLVAGGQFNIASGITINADMANLVMESAGAFTLDSSKIANTFGNVAMEFGGDVNLQDNATINSYGDLTITTTGNFNMANSQVDANTVELQAPVAPATAGSSGAMTINSSTIVCEQHGLFTSASDMNINNSVIVSDAGTGSLSFNSANGSVNLTDTSLQTSYLTINSGDGILLSGTGQAFSSNGGTANLTAVNTVAINNQDMSQFANVNIASKTINLYDVNFGNGTVNLKSLNGLWNNGSSVFGDVNDLGGVTYNGNTVVAANGTSGTLAGTGITIGKIK